MREIAKHGRGQSECVLDSNGLAEKLLFLLEKAITHVIDEFIFTFDESVVDYMLPGKGSFNVIKNEPIHFYILFNKKFS